MPNSAHLPPQARLPQPPSGVALATFVLSAGMYLAAIANLENTVCCLQYRVLLLVMRCIPVLVAALIAAATLLLPSTASAVDTCVTGIKWYPGIQIHDQVTRRSAS